MTSGHGEPENPVRKWCSTNQRVSKPTLSASAHCSSVSLYSVFQSTSVPSNGRCISYSRPNCMVHLLLGLRTGGHAHSSRPLRNRPPPPLRPGRTASLVGVEPPVRPGPLG